MADSKQQTPGSAASRTSFQDSDTVEVDGNGVIGQGGPMEGEAEPEPQQAPADDNGRNDETDPTDGAAGGESSGSTVPVPTSEGGLANAVEPELLAISSIEAIGKAIAERVPGAIETTEVKRIVLADPSLLATLRLHHALLAEVERLEQQLQPGTDTSAFALAPLIPVVKTILAGAGRLGTVLKGLQPFLATEITHSARRFELQRELLQAAVANRLMSKKLEVVLPGLFPKDPAKDGLVLRCLRLAGHPKPTDETDPKHQAAQAAAALLEKLFAKPVDAKLPTLAEQLVTVQGIPTDPGTAILVVEIALAGGNYRLKKSLWRSLLGLDGLSYSGGAAATFFLVSADDQRLLAGDVLYSTTGHTRFSRGSATVPRQNFAEAS